MASNIPGQLPTKQKNTMWVHTTTVWVNRPQNTSREQISKSLVYPASTPTTQTPPCGHAQPVCGLIDLKMLVENNFQPPVFLLRVPLDQHKQPLCGHAEPLENYFLGRMFIKGPPPLPTNIDNQ